MDYAKKIYIFLALAGTLLILIYAQSIILPFILAILFWAMIRIIRKQFMKVRYINRAPQWLLTMVSTFALLSILVLIGNLLSNNIQQLSGALPGYKSNIDTITASINTTFGIDLVTILSEFTAEYNFSGLLSSTISAVTGLFGDAFMILLYLVFLLLEEPLFPRKITAMYPVEKDYLHMTELIGKIDDLISNYLGIKTLVSVMTGFCSYIVLLLVGVEAPLFWAFLIFILNFIPTVGSLIATLFPAIFALFQFGEFSQSLIILSVVGSIQVVFGNFVEPKLMGSTLNISPLVVFLTLALWGLIWGITGMLLSVPITVSIIIIMSEFPGTRPIAILLSQKGLIKDE
jgi:predicted PurR-regulated permease PerM